MIDVCFILEGTYPYVAGGVSTWVHQLISAIKDLRFGIVYIAPHSDPTRRLKYEVPNHVLSFQEVYLHDYDLTRDRVRRPTSSDFQMVRQDYEALLQGEYDHFSNFMKMFYGPERCFDLPTFFTSKEIYRLLRQFYERYAAGHSFIDFFWTWRGTHLPLLQILRTELPRAKIYHAISTGYAGLLSVLAKTRYGGKFFLTEHGIYTHERLLEISQANWIYEREERHFRADRELSFFKQWWIGLFQTMSRLAYYHCDQIFTLFEGNKTRQILNGADPGKIQIIPNGIDVQHHKQVVRERRAAPHIGLIGRVVNIKDIKTFIQAARLVIDALPTPESGKARFYVAGPVTEEADYYQECKLLTEALHLEEQLTFTGPIDVSEYYRFLDLVVLTSISEAQPYAILEANFAGIPVVATDVGACREMLEGRDESDRGLGPSGLITEVASPQATAQAILRLLQDRTLYDKCSKAGINRVTRYYDQDDLFSRYLNAYERSL